MINKKFKEIFGVVYKVIFILFVVPSLLTLVSIIGFWVMYLSLTSPILAEYQSQITFKIGMLNVAFGVCVAQIIIIIKSLNYCFKEEDKRDATKN